MRRIPTRGRKQGDQFPHPIVQVLMPVAESLCNPHLLLLLPFPAAGKENDFEIKKQKYRIQGFQSFDKIQMPFQLRFILGQQDSEVRWKS